MYAVESKAHILCDGRESNVTAVKCTMQPHMFEDTVETPGTGTHNEKNLTTSVRHEEGCWGAGVGAPVGKWVPDELCFPQSLLCWTLSLCAR